jgi:ADP-heptose:LPS heptosyltransferase
MDHRKILILRLSAVGDVIRTLAAVKALKEYYPSSSITWVVEEPIPPCLVMAELPPDAGSLAL